MHVKNRNIDEQIHVMGGTVAYGCNEESRIVLHFPIRGSIDRIELPELPD